MEKPQNASVKGLLESLQKDKNDLRTNQNLFKISINPNGLNLHAICLGTVKTKSFASGVESSSVLVMIGDCKNIRGEGIINLGDWIAIDCLIALSQEEKDKIEKPKKKKSENMRKYFSKGKYTLLKSYDVIFVEFRNGVGNIAPGDLIKILDLKGKASKTNLNDTIKTFINFNSTITKKCITSVGAAYNCFKKNNLYTSHMTKNTNTFVEEDQSTHYGKEIYFIYISNPILNKIKDMEIENNDLDVHEALKIIPPNREGVRTLIYISSEEFNFMATTTNSLVGAKMGYKISGIAVQMLSDNTIQKFIVKLPFGEDFIKKSFFIKNVSLWTHFGPLIMENADCFALASINIKATCNDPKNNESINLNLVEDVSFSLSFSPKLMAVDTINVYKNLGIKVTNEFIIANAKYLYKGDTPNTEPSNYNNDVVFCLNDENQPLNMVLGAFTNENYQLLVIVRLSSRDEETIIKLKHANPEEASIVLTALIKKDMKNPILSKYQGLSLLLDSSNEIKLLAFLIVESRLKINEGIEEYENFFGLKYATSPQQKPSIPMDVLVESIIKINDQALTPKEFDNIKNFYKSFDDQIENQHLLNDPNHPNEEDFHDIKSIGKNEHEKKSLQQEKKEQQNKEPEHKNEDNAHNKSKGVKKRTKEEADHIDNQQSLLEQKKKRKITENISTK
jgi:hypothetical protein